MDIGRPGLMLVKISISNRLSIGPSGMPEVVLLPKEHFLICTCPGLVGFYQLESPSDLRLKDYLFLRQGITDKPAHLLV